jgi:hypothetical protein
VSVSRAHLEGMAAPAARVGLGRSREEETSATRVGLDDDGLEQMPVNSDPTETTGSTDGENREPRNGEKASRRDDTSWTDGNAHGLSRFCIERRIPTRGD